MAITFAIALSSSSKIEDWRESIRGKKKKDTLLRTKCEIIIHHDKLIARYLLIKPSLFRIIYIHLPIH